MANVGPTLWFVRDNAPTSTIGWSAVTAWATGATVAAGVLRRQLAAPTVGNERVFVAIVAGTTHATTEPTWVVTKGAKTTDNTVTWQEVTGQPGVNGNTTDSPTWLQNKNIVVTLGLIIYDSGTASLQIVSTAGTTGNGSTPGFSATAGTTTADNTVTWTSLGLASGFAAWAAPFARLQSVSVLNWAAAGQSVFVGDDHAETQAAAMTITSVGTTILPLNFYSIDHSLAVTLAAATLKTGASVSTTGANAISVTGTGFTYNGFTFSAGSGATNATLSVAPNTNGGAFSLYNCALIKVGTVGIAGAITIGQQITRTVLVNTTVKFGATADYLILKGGSFEWRDTASAVQGATIPTNFIYGASVPDFTPQISLRGVDLSAVTGTLIFSAVNSSMNMSLTNCKLASGLAVSAILNPGMSLAMVSCDSAATNYQKRYYTFLGTLLSETVIIRTGGASSGTSVSDKITSTANTGFLMPFRSIPIAIWNDTTGTNRVVTLAGVWNAAAVPNNDDIWIEAEYFGSALTPQASLANNTKANNLATGTALTADSTSAWDSLVTARANTTAYSLGNVIKVASNPGRIFFCTTAGTSSGSEPVGYASAVDGGSVTDNTAVFRAGVRFSLAVTLSSPQPAMVGPIYVTVNAAKISSTFYIDPLVTLT